MSLSCFICVTCGTQFPPSDREPECCPICEDERQYVAEGGQKWTTLQALRRRHRNVMEEEGPNLFSLLPKPRCGIGQRAFVVQTEEGNLLWDCVPLLDEETIARVESLGGLAGIAISHPHYYTTMVAWSRAFGHIPIYLHRDDTEWVMRPDEVIQFWEGEQHPLFGGLTLVRTGGHFDGFQVLHRPDGAEGRGVLLAGDQPFVCQDRQWVSFMYSYPNLIPLAAPAIRRIVSRLSPLDYDRLYGAFSGQRVNTDARAVVERSAARYLRAIGAE